MKVSGVGVGSSLGLGAVRHFSPLLPAFERTLASHTTLSDEQAAALAAFDNLSAWYKERAIHSTTSDVAELCRFYVMTLSSPALRGEVTAAIETEHVSAPHAFTVALAKKQEELAALENPYLRERARDLADLSARLLKTFLGIDELEVSDLCEPSILVVHELPPSLLLARDLSQVKGIVTEVGGKTSHAAILCTILGIPAVFGVTDAIKLLPEGQMALLDAQRGFVHTGLSAGDITTAREHIAHETRLAQERETLIGKSTTTRDGRSLKVLANAGDLLEIDEVARVCPEGVGLFRTEFLYLDRPTVPSEDYLFSVTQGILAKIPGEVTLRTLDIGGDKEIPALHIAQEDNPFLGNRGIRFCLRQPKLFASLLRAYLRASATAPGKMALMYPMVSTLDEIKQAQTLLTQVKGELDQAGVAYDAALRTGIMIETPAAALRAAEFLAEVGFISIGTNDLTQYTLAVDRGNSEVADLYNSLDPAVLGLIKHVIDAAHAADRIDDLEMCGEMAADPRALIALVGLGLTTFSVSTASVLRTKDYLSRLDAKACLPLAKAALSASDARSAEAILDEAACSFYGELYHGSDCC